MSKPPPGVAWVSTHVLKPTTGTIRRHPPAPAGGQEARGFRIEQETGERLDALQVLQLRRDQPLTDSALAVPLEFVYDALPERVRRDVHVLKARRDFPKEYSELALCRKKYHFWPIYADKCAPGFAPHWVLVVLQLRHDPLGKAFSSDETCFNAVEGYTVITPNVGLEAREFESVLAAELKVMLANMGIGVDCAIWYRGCPPLR